MKLPRSASACFLSALLVSSSLVHAEDAAPLAANNAAEAESQDPLYQEAERQFLKGDAQGALATLARFFAQGAGTPVRSQIRARNLRGLIYFQSKNPQGATQEFEAAVQLANRGLQHTDTLLHLTRYNLGNAQFQVGKVQEALDTLQSVNAEALDADTRVRFHHLFGNVLANREQHLDSLLNYLLAAQGSKEVAARDTFLQKAMNASKNIFLKDPKTDLERIAALNLPEDSAAGIAARILVARGFMYAGDPKEAETILKNVLEKAEPTHPLRPRAEEALADLSKLTDVRPQVVGVLLPLSGKFGKFGRLCLNAVNLAMGAFEEMPENPKYNGLRLVVRDSGESPESAQAAFNELVKNEKAIAVIGPLLSKQFTGVARKAQEFGVPLLSLSQRVDDGQLGSYVFPVALSPAQQVELIVRQAIEVKGYKRFAVFAPRDSFGEEYVNLFWNAVEKAGGEVVGIERYEPKSTDFREEVRRLLGLDYMGARTIEAAELKRRQDRYAATLKVKGKLRQRLLQAYEPKAMVDFDAVFIPDDPSTVGQIAPAFAVEDVSNIPLLGINTWNTPEIVQRAGKYLQQSIFVDGFLASSRDPRTQQFVLDYRKYFQAVPGTIEVQAFDAAKILLDTLGDSHPGTRAQAREKLLGRGQYAGISGEFRFTPEGVQRSAHLLTVKGNAITEISPEAPAQQ
jgi:branched-chain amino acid transport system substrate-binding protein